MQIRTENLVKISNALNTSISEIFIEVERDEGI